MSVLLDTHAFLWWSGEPERLSQTACSFLENKENLMLLSFASVWEIQIKVQPGKLRLSKSLASILEVQQQNGIGFLRIELAHILRLEQLPLYHKDPFDRLLVAQAMAEDIPILSKDALIAQYGVRTIW